MLGGAIINNDKDTMISIVGYSANVILFLFYGAPLSVLYEVISSRCAKKLLFPLSLLSTVNGLCWTVYGAAIGDYFIVVPNGAGAFLGFVQLIMIWVFAANSSKDTAKIHEMSTVTDNNNPC